MCDKDGDVVRRDWGAGEQLPVVSSTEVIIGEDLIEGQSWTIGVVLLVTVGVVLPGCACIVCYSHLPTEGYATREPEVAEQQSVMSPRSMRADNIDHVKERTWILSWCSGDQLWQLMMLNTRSFLWEAGTVLAAHCHH